MQTIAGERSTTFAMDLPVSPETFSSKMRIGVVMPPFVEADHAREHGKFVSVGGAVHASGAGSAAHAATKTATSKAPVGAATAQDHHEHAAAHIDAAVAHLKAADVHHKAAEKAPGHASKGQHEAQASMHEAKAADHAKQSSGAIAKAKAALSRSGLGAWAHSKGEKKPEGEKGGEKPAILKAAEKFHEGVATLGEKATAAAEHIIEGNPLGLGKALIRGGAAVLGAGLHKGLGIKKKEEGGEHERGSGGPGYVGLKSGKKQEKFGGEFEKLRDREHEGGEGGDFYDAEQDDDDVEA
jgi:hypothetical protein